MPKEQELPQELGYTLGWGDGRGGVFLPLLQVIDSNQDELVTPYGGSQRAHKINAITWIERLEKESHDYWGLGTP